MFGISLMYISVRPNFSLLITCPNSLYISTSASTLFVSKIYVYTVSITPHINIAASKIIKPVATLFAIIVTLWAVVEVQPLAFLTVNNAW